MKDSLSYEDVPFELLDRQVRRLRNKEVGSVKILWRSHSVKRATWEVEAAIKSKTKNGNFEKLQVPPMVATHETFRVGGPWFTTATPPQIQLRKLANSRSMDRPTVRRPDHSLWSGFMD
ncbi:hypothetical protein MTR67_019334 [Solanum verrucosum]|uniref:Uncharacterized protein n=1 Tax=Solanum verrucosum TaxID=315347 RepID=A0AAF0QLC3_SOLVR|nr:hypothetical protein MTR67_019334 [Solanum verrucosum]